MAPARMATIAFAALAGMRSVSAFQPSSLSITATARASTTLVQPQVPAVPKAAANSAFSTPLVMSAVLLGAVASAASRSRSKAAAGVRAAQVVRNVTVAEIDNLTVADIPESFRTKISLGMARRHELKEAIKETLSRTFFIFAWNISGMTFPQLQQSRAMFPPSVTCRVLKNAQVRKAMEGTPWAGIRPYLRGSNMYCFVHEDTDLKPTVEAYLKIERQFNRVAKVAELAEKEKLAFELRANCGGMLVDDFEYIDPADIPKFKNFPTRLELIAQIAGGIKQVTQKIAVGINQVPKKLAVGTKKIVEKMEDEGKASVADVVA